MQDIELRLRGGHITLDQLLKATGVADSGGQAKAMVAEGQVRVDGITELRKTRKLREGAIVTLGETRIRVLGAEGAGPAQTRAEAPRTSSKAPKPENPYATTRARGQRRRAQDL